MDIVISSGHGLKVRGASGVLDEVNEARRLCDRVAGLLRAAKVGVRVFHDDTSTTVNQNLASIVNYHNSQKRDRDVSVHFNAYKATSEPMGTECLFVSQSALAAKVSQAIAKAGQFIDRGPKKRTDLYFLNRTAMPAVLLEICFVDSTADADCYRRNFEAICQAAAQSIADIQPQQPTASVPEPVTWFRDYRCTVFGGRADPNNSAYPPYDAITDEEFAVALPYRFSSERPQVVVVNRANGKRCLCQIRDIGPWLIDDPYWTTADRALAETCWKTSTPLPRGPNKGTIGNGAGIDVTPAVARALGFDGMGTVDWAFTPDVEEGEA